MFSARQRDQAILMVLLYLRRGKKLIKACKDAGISHETWRKWRLEGHVKSVQLLHGIALPWEDDDHDNGAPWRSKIETR